MSHTKPVVSQQDQDALEDRGLPDVLVRADDPQRLHVCLCKGTSRRDH